MSIKTTLRDTVKTFYPLLQLVPYGEILYTFAKTIDKYSSINGDVTDENIASKSLKGVISLGETAKTSSVTE